MKKHLLWIVLFECLALHAVKAQTADDYFLLGTFSDYCGYYYIDTSACEVDRYLQHEKKLAKYIRTLLTEKYKEENVRMKRIPNRYHIYCCTPYKTMFSLYQQTHELSNPQSFTREQTLAYLHGVYLRYSRPINDTLYLITVSNSSHGRLFYQLAQRLGFTNSKIEELNNIPHTTRVYFTPTTEFLEFVKSTSRLKQKLLADEEKMWKKLFDFDVEAFKKSYHE